MEWEVLMGALQLPACAPRLSDQQRPSRPIRSREEAAQTVLTDQLLPRQMLLMSSEILEVSHARYFHFSATSGDPRL